MRFFPIKGSSTGSKFSGKFSMRTILPLVIANSRMFRQFFWSSLTTTNCSPYLALIHLMPWRCNGRLANEFMMSNNILFIIFVNHREKKGTVHCLHWMAPSAPSLAQVHTCGSMIISGQRSELVRMMAFFVDILSDGRPSLFHTAMVASSVRSLMGSKLWVIGMIGCGKRKDNC